MPYAAKPLYTGALLGRIKGARHCPKLQMHLIYRTLFGADRHELTQNQAPRRLRPPSRATAFHGTLRSLYTGPRRTGASLYSRRAP
jgi:hypothetical protein